MTIVSYPPAVEGTHQAKLQYARLMMEMWKLEVESMEIGVTDTTTRLEESKVEENNSTTTSKTRETIGYDSTTTSQTRETIQNNSTTQHTSQMRDETIFELRAVFPPKLPQEVAIKNNLAKAIFGERLSSLILDFFIYKNPYGQRLSVMFGICWWLGHGLGM
jgi:hypothetical protein